MPRALILCNSADFNHTSHKYDSYNIMSHKSIYCDCDVKPYQLWFPEGIR